MTVVSQETDKQIKLASTLQNDANSSRRKIAAELSYSHIHSTHLSFMKCFILTMAFSSIFLRKVLNLSFLFSSILPSARSGRFV